MTYSPPLTLLVPKLLPTVPVQRQVFPAEFFHVAVAVAPTFRQVTARFSRDSTGEPKTMVKQARDARTPDFMVDNGDGESYAEMLVVDCSERCERSVMLLDTVFICRYHPPGAYIAARTDVNEGCVATSDPASIPDGVLLSRVAVRQLLLHFRFRQMYVGAVRGQSSAGTSDHFSVELPACVGEMTRSSRYFTPYSEPGSW